MVEEKYIEVFDSTNTLKCVRFLSGRVGVVDYRGKVVLQLDNYERLEFHEYGFLKATNGRTFFVDIHSGAVYTSMPEVVRIGGFELTAIGGYLCTRTKELYEVKADWKEVWLSRNGSYLTLPYKQMPTEEIRNRIIQTPLRYTRCLLYGDGSKTYWKIDVFEDGTLLVMDDEGHYYHVQHNTKGGKTIKEHLGQVTDVTEKSRILHVVDELRNRITERLANRTRQAQRIVEEILS